MKQRVNIDPIDNKKNEVNNISEDSWSSQLNETIKWVKNQVENLQNSNTNVIDFITDKDDLDTMFDKLFEIMKPFLAAKTFKELKIFNNFDDNLKDKVLKDIYNMFIDEIFKKILEKYPTLSEQSIDIIFSVVQSLSKYANNWTKEGELSELNIEEIIQNSIKSKIDIFSLDIINTYKKELDDIINNVTNKINIDLTDPIAISSYNSIIWCEIKKSADTKYLDLLVKNWYKVDYQENIAKNSCTTGLERNINFYLQYNKYDKLENISKLLNLIKKQEIDVDLYKIFKDCFKNCFKNEINYFDNKSDNIKTLIDCFKKNNIDLNIKEVFQELFEENIQNGRKYIDKLAWYAKLVEVYLDFNKDFIQNYFISEFKKVFNWNEFAKKIEQYLENGIFIDYNEAFQLYIDKTCDIKKIIINEESDYLSLWKKEINKIITFIKSKWISFDIQKIYQFELEKSLQSGIGWLVEKIIKIAESDGISLNFWWPNIIDFCENWMIKILSKYGFPLNKFPVIDNRKIFELVKSYWIKVDYNKIYKEALTISWKTNTKILFSIIKYMEENNIVFEIDLKKILKERLLEEINNGESNCAWIIIEYLDENNIKFDYNSSDFKTSLQTGTEKAFKRKNCQDIKYLLEFSDLKWIILEFLTPNIINSCPTFLLEKYTNLPENLLSQFKNNKDFWDIWIEKDILTIIQHYSEIP